MSIITNQGLSHLKEAPDTTTFTYLNDNDRSQQNNISKADIVFEYLGLNDRTVYTAVFKDNLHKTSIPLSSKKNPLSKYIPKFNVSDSVDLLDTYTMPASSIFVTFNEYTSSNFVFSNGYYYHFKDTIKDIDNANDSEVIVSNIIIQFIDSINFKDGITEVNGSGNGYIFSCGKASNMKWIKGRNSPIKMLDISDIDITLSPGRTWWILINKNSSVAFN